jgi:hypothetical protein
MTLREYLNRRSMRVSLFCAALIGAGWIFALNAPKGSTRYNIAGAVGVAAIAVFVVMTSRTRCPKCKERIGYIEHGSWRRCVKSMIRDLKIERGAS